jgi:hypothetical protein
MLTLPFVYTFVLTVLQLGYTSDIFFVICVCLGKLSVILLLLRLSNSKKDIRMSYIGCAVCALYGVASILIIAIRNPLITPGEHVLERWIVIEVLGSLIDIAIMVFPFHLIRDLQMQPGTKFTVISGFALRLPYVCPFAAPCT